MAELAVGIDLGTSNSCVSVVRGGEVEVLYNGYNEMTTASVVAFQDDGMIEVGNHAKANIIHDPANTICSAKRLIGRYFFSEEVKKAQAVCAYEIVEGPNHGVRVIARDEEFSLPEISAMVLREMKQIADNALGEEVTKAVITVPAYFNDNQRQATKDAGRIAGLDVLRILNEPTAAALAYGFGRGLNQRVAVYDLGGGTFDVSVLEIGKDIFEVLSTCGDTFLGGDDFDDRLIDLLADEVIASTGVNPRNDPYAFEKIKAAAEAAKKTLSMEPEAEILIPDLVESQDGKGFTLQRMIAADEYNGLVMDLVTRTFKVCDEALQQADLTANDLDGVILVGGPTRLPVVRESVAAYFQRDLKDNVDPDAVVAKGAAIHAASLVSDDDDTSTDAFLLDVTPLDLRIGVAGGLAEPVIERNTPVPIEQTRRFTTTRDEQESVQIKVFQGGDRSADGNELLGQFDFSGFRKAPRGDVAIDVTFEINADGIVEVTAFDPDTEQKASTTLTLSSGLSGDELEQIIEEGKTSRVKTEPPPRPAAPPAAAASRAAPDLAPVLPSPVSAPPEAEPEPEPIAGIGGPDLELDEWGEGEGPPELEVDDPPAPPAPAVPAVQAGPEAPVAASAAALEVAAVAAAAAGPAAELSGLTDAAPETELAAVELPAVELPAVELTPLQRMAVEDSAPEIEVELEPDPGASGAPVEVEVIASRDVEIDLESLGQEDLAIDDEDLLELADEVIEEDVATVAKLVTAEEVEAEAEEERRKEDLFDTTQTNLSAGIEEE